MKKMKIIFSWDFLTKKMREKNLKYNLIKIIEKELNKKINMGKYLVNYYIKFFEVLFRLCLG